MDRGLLQREVGDLLGVDERTVQNWEKGRNSPLKGFVDQIEDLLSSRNEDAAAETTDP
jgi:transcriptional regulator with XRE-family HTH domain